MLSAEMLDLLRQWWKARPSRGDAGRVLFGGSCLAETRSSRVHRQAAGRDYAAPLQLNENC